MLKKIIIASLIMVSFASCKSRKQAFDYSQDFVKKEMSLMEDITTTENKVERFFSAAQYDSIAIAGEKMEQLVEVKIQELKNAPAPDVKEGENFKEACLKYFRFIKSMYTGYKNFGSAATEEQREAEKTKIIELTGKRQDAMNDIKAAQKKYADANGFKLEK